MNGTRTSYTQTHERVITSDLRSLVKHNELHCCRRMNGACVCVGCLWFMEMWLTLWTRTEASHDASYRNWNNRNHHRSQYTNVGRRFDTKIHSELVGFEPKTWIRRFIIIKFKCDSSRLCCSIDVMRKSVLWVWRRVRRHYAYALMQQTLRH